MKLYSIHYKGDDQNPRVFEGITDNFKKWLEEHNSNREDGFEEDADEFEVEEISLYLYNKGN
jgi:predicted GIY-YIG superfamily endonuclease|tara:strand:+ start:326 stop:511 length:186 start_codon:yes stop_codon:yes gene_type:complete